MVGAREARTKPRSGAGMSVQRPRSSHEVHPEQPDGAQAHLWCALRGGSPNVFIDIGRAFCVFLGVKNLAILAQIDTQRQQISDTLRIFEERVGAKNYELSNHLGNVLATISDKTIFNTDHYNSIVYSAQLYYPFGWEIPTLSYTAKKYRFGFNNQEQDPETGWIHFKYREEDPRVGRFFAVDPITTQYPELTPYQFASNSPIWMHELEGLEGMPSTLEQWQDGISNGTPATADQPGYSASNRQSVFDRLTNRGSGALQVAAGFVAGVASAPFLLSPEPFTKVIGVTGLAYSVDQMATGGKKVWTGEDHKTLFNQGVSQGQQFFGVDEQTANNNASWAEFTVDVFAFSPKSYTNSLLKSSTAGAGVLKAGASIAKKSDSNLISIDDFLTNPKLIWDKKPEDIAKMFNDAGYEAIIEKSSKGSKLSEQIRIKGHIINNIQVHPGGTHGGKYYKISTSNQGIIKVADKATYYNNRGQENATFYWIDKK
jgi:RHS repeat-associated protein